MTVETRSKTKKTTRKVADPPAPPDSLTLSIVRLAVDELSTGPWNQRPADDDVSSLADSIRTQGQLDPIQVRRRPVARKGKAPYEIVAGERRWRAAQLAGLGCVDAIVRTCSDAEAAAICYAENAEREDLPPLAEAQAVARVVQEAGDLAIAAEILGRSVVWVSTRARVATGLAKGWKDHVASGDIPSSWGVGHLGLIARLDAGDQEELLHNYRVDEARTAKDLEKAIDHVVARRLVKAGWKQDFTGGLKGAPACGDCPRRSSQQRALFADLEPSEDRCLDGRCWQLRAQAWALHEIEQTKEKHADKGVVVVAPDGYHRSADAWWRNEKAVAGAKVVNPWEVKPAKKGEKGAVPAVVIHEGNRVTKTWVKKPSSRSSSSSGRSAAPKISREDRLRNHRWSALCGEAQKAIVAVDAVGLELPQVAALAVAFGTWGNREGIWGGMGTYPFGCSPLGRRLEEDLDDEEIDDLEELGADGTDAAVGPGYRLRGEAKAWERALWVRDAPGPEVLVALWESVQPVLHARCEWRGASQRDRVAAELERVSAYLSLDLAAMRARVEEAVPVPASWPEKAREAFTW